MSTRAEIAERVIDAKCRLLDRYAWACKLTEAMAECERRNEVRGAMENDERREVARRLREIADRHDGVAATIIERRLGLESDERFLAGSVFTSKVWAASPTSSSQVTSCQNNF